MRWYNDSVAEAVETVKSTNSYLFVLVKEDNVHSNYEDILENSNAVETCLKNFICLKLIKDSIEYHQFSSVYEVKELPSLFIIHYNGTVLKLVSGSLTEESLIAVLNEAMNDTAGDKVVPELETKVTESNITKLNQEDMLAERRAKLAEKRQKRLEEEKEKEKQDEIGRRELGKNLQKLQMTQKEINDKELKDELKRQKLEDKEARDRVLRQIEEDKLERRRMDNIKALDETTVKQRHVAQPVATSTDAAVTSSNVSRLQFRFPDGSSTNYKFQSDDKFEKVREFVANFIVEKYGRKLNFEIRQFFPKRLFTSEDNQSTLKVLELVPSASFAITFLSGASSSNVTMPYVTHSLVSYAMKPVFFFLSIIRFVCQWFQSFFGNTWQGRQGRLQRPESRVIKKEGNMFRFTDASKKNEDDDDEARWNGNSTQQM